MGVKTDRIKFNNYNKYKWSKDFLKSKKKKKTKNPNQTKNPNPLRLDFEKTQVSGIYTKCASNTGTS